MIAKHMQLLLNSGEDLLLSGYQKSINEPNYITYAQKYVHSYDIIVYIGNFSLMRINIL